MLKIATSTVPMMESSIGCIIAIDAGILEEATKRAEITIGQIAIDQPSELKQAGHYAFWARKLKPLRIIDLAELKDTVEQLKGLTLLKGSITEIQDIPTPPPDSSLFINELFAILVAVSVARTGGFNVKIEAQPMHDLATTLRYNSFSPAAVSAILQPHATNVG